MDGVLAGLQQQLQGGVEVVGLASNAGDTPHSSGYDFFAVWKMPNQEVARRFESFVESAGWHDYFEQVNARGQMMELEDFVSAHLEARER